MKTGIIDVGGGMRGIYAAGVLDRFLDEGITFDLGIGVSAGSANLASFSARQRGRNFVFYTEYSLQKEYMGWGNLLRRGSFINMDYVYGTLSNADGAYPLDYTTLVNNPMDFLVVAADAITGEPVYFDKSNLAQDSYDPMKASSSIPFVCKPYYIDGVPYYDGALADPIPLLKAFEEGCEQVVVILTKPADKLREPGTDPLFARMIARKYPRAAQGLRARAQRYNACVAEALRLQSEGCALVIAPSDTCGVDTLTRDANAMKALYQKGYEDGALYRG